MQPVVKLKCSNVRCFLERNDEANAFIIQYHFSFFCMLRGICVFICIENSNDRITTKHTHHRLNIKRLLFRPHSNGLFI